MNINEYIPPTNSTDLLEQAFEAEAYINNSTRKQRQKVRDSLAILNLAASELYLGKAANLTGLLIYTSPTPKREAPEQFETHIGYSSFDGASVGFAALDLESELAPIERNLSAVELDLAEVLRYRANGRFVMCHIVSYMQGNWTPNSMLISTDVTYQAAGPLASSNLYTDQSYDKLPRADRHKEVSRILDSMHPSQTRLFNHIFSELMQSEDQLLSAIASGRKLRELFTKANLVERNALMYALDFALETNLIGKQFKFDNGIPMSLEPVDEGVVDVCVTEPGVTCYLQIDGVLTAPFYKDSAQQNVDFSQEKGFYLKTTAWGDDGNPSTLYVPVEHLHAYPYTQLVPE